MLEKTDFRGHIEQLSNKYKTLKHSTYSIFWCNVELQRNEERTKHKEW